MSINLKIFFVFICYGAIAYLTIYKNMKFLAYV